MGHIAEMELEQLLDGTLPFLKKAFVKQHLAVCPECAKRMEYIHLEREEFACLAVELRRLEEADTLSRKITAQTVTTLWS
jgi:anti-sigma factor RsiW